jgi:hypothetical protein
VRVAHGGLSGPSMNSAGLRSLCPSMPPRMRS